MYKQKHSIQLLFIFSILILSSATLLLGQSKSLGKTSIEPPLVSGNEWEPFIHSFIYACIY